MVLGSNPGGGFNNLLFLICLLDSNPGPIGHYSNGNIKMDLGSNPKAERVNQVLSIY